MAAPRRVAMLVLGAALAAPVAAAQPSAPPGPYVMDVRGVTLGLPNDTRFFPLTPTEVVVPTRGFGFEVGAHVYLLTLGAARVGLGASLLRVRGTSEAIVSNATAVAPQISFNFGTTNGWSYLSAGLGRAWIDTRVRDGGMAGTGDSGGLTALNAGGGARWFLNRHVAIGFDIRVHRMGAGAGQGTLPGTPRTTQLAVAAGVSLR